MSVSQREAQELSLKLSGTRGQALCHTPEYPAESAPAPRTPSHQAPAARLCPHRTARSAARPAEAAARLGLQRPFLGKDSSAQLRWPECHPDVTSVGPHVGGLCVNLCSSDHNSNEVIQYLSGC